MSQRLGPPGLLTSWLSWPSLLSGPSWPSWPERQGMLSAGHSTPAIKKVSVDMVATDISAKGARQAVQH